MTEGDELYIDLGDGENTPDPNAPLMAMFHRLQWDMAEIRSQNDGLSIANEEHEKLIRELTSWNNQEGEGFGKRRKGKFSDSEEDDTTKHQSKQKKELHGEFQKIKPPSYDGEEEEDAEAWLLNMIKYFQVYEY